jgi:DNA primase
MPTVDGQDVLPILTDVFNIEGELRGKEFYIHCPNPGHVDRSPSCSVSVESGLWHCFACGVGGDLYKLGQIILGYTPGEVKELLKPKSAESLLRSVQSRLSKLTYRERKTKIELPGPYESGPLGELRSRGFSQETLRRWGVRYVTWEKLRGHKGPFNIQKSFAIPIRNEDGKLEAWCYRRSAESPQWQPKYVYTPGTDLTRMWYGLEHHSQAGTIVVVEGALDAMWLDQCGIPALAMLGSQPSEQKILRLQNYRQVLLLGDCDAAGAIAVERIGKVLANRVGVRVARYPKWCNAKDPQELHPVDVEVVLAQAVSWAEWRTSLVKRRSN